MEKPDGFKLFSSRNSFAENIKRESKLLWNKYAKLKKQWAFQHFLIVDELKHLDESELILSKKAKDL